MTQNKKGFTLIELVVVMAIIAVLAALMVTAIVAARKQANNTQITGNAKTIETGLETYSAKSVGKYPTTAQVTNVDAYNGSGMSAFLVTNGTLSSTPSGLAATQIYWLGDANGSAYSLVACSTGNTAFDGTAPASVGSIANQGIGTRGICDVNHTVIYATAR